MTEENFEKLAAKWPELFEKTKYGYPEVGDGWFDILDVLCGKICAPVRMSKNRIENELNRNGNQRTEKVIELEAQLEERLKEIPVIVQIKEKFGALRFYVDYSNDQIGNYISFAEAMSAKVCEECGSPGQARTGGWIKTLCDKHAEERKKKYDQS